MAHLFGAEGLHLECSTRAVLDSVTLGVREGESSLRVLLALTVVAT
ncbi:hypothetical protein L2X99_02400 [Microbacterium sp. KUDC0406]|nr:hypothetical protein [Microbacterium sp. KUDC0406]UJP10554.1 hypothetical protein L2X99_02400 [Microbacterium sp. KUDC0406]